MVVSADLGHPVRQPASPHGSGNACILLILHGMAGGPVGAAGTAAARGLRGGTADLPSAIRLNSTARSLGIPVRPPVVGFGACCWGLGPVHGILGPTIAF